MVDLSLCTDGATTKRVCVFLAGRVSDRDMNRYPGTAGITMLIIQVFIVNRNGLPPVVVKQFEAFLCGAGGEGRVFAQALGIYFAAAFAADAIVGNRTGEYIIL